MELRHIVQAALLAGTNLDGKFMNDDMKKYWGASVVDSLKACSPPRPKSWVIETHNLISKQPRLPQRPRPRYEPTQILLA